MSAQEEENDPVTTFVPGEVEEVALEQRCQAWNYCAEAVVRRQQEQYIPHPPLTPRVHWCDQSQGRL